MTTTSKLAYICAAMLVCATDAGALRGPELQSSLETFLEVPIRTTLINRGSSRRGKGPWCGNPSSGRNSDAQKCSDAYWTGRNGRNYPCYYNSQKQKCQLDLSKYAMVYYPSQKSFGRVTTGVTESECARLCDSEQTWNLKCLGYTYSLRPGNLHGNACVLDMMSTILAHLMADDLVPAADATSNMIKACENACTANAHCEQAEWDPTTQVCLLSGRPDGFEAPDPDCGRNPWCSASV